MSEGTRVVQWEVDIATLSKVKLLESRLFDDQGHLRHDVGEKRAVELLSDINVLRHKLGWLNMDLKHNLVWPDEQCR